MPFRIRFVPYIILCSLFFQLSCEESDEAESVDDLNSLANEYVYLTLSLGNHDKYYVDAYFGPDSVMSKAKNDSLSLDKIQMKLQELHQKIIQLSIPNTDSSEIKKLRKSRLLAHTSSALAFAEKLSGSELTFEEEVERLYGYLYVPMDLDEINSIIGNIDALLPGTGSISERWEPLRNRFRIPLDKIDTLFIKSINSAREITLGRIDLPQTEMFEVEYVIDQPWSAYNWYKGSYYSLIQVNTDADIFIDRAIDLAAHEGYPGHHTYQSLMEKYFIKDRYWPEYTIYPLYSPTSFLSEGLAEYGINMTFDEEARYRYERDTLMILAGMDTTGFDLYKRVSRLVGRLDHAGLYAASAYMNGNLNREETEKFLVEYALLSEEKAKQRLDFIERFGAYIINYTLGIELIDSYISQVSLSGSKDARWAAYLDVLTNPYLPKDLIIR